MVNLGCGKTGHKTIFSFHYLHGDFVFGGGGGFVNTMEIFLMTFHLCYLFTEEYIVSMLGRMIMVLWLFVLMVITSSYTASLTSILTIQQLSSPITGIDSLIASNWPIGYQVGSFAYSYLADSLYISRSRLIPLGSPEEYEKALKLGPSNGGVAAIVDELPYVELFLSKQTEFAIIGQAFTRGGWGFVSILSIIRQALGLVGLKPCQLLTQVDVFRNM